METEVGESQERSIPHSSRESENVVAENRETEERGERPSTADTVCDRGEKAHPLHVCTLGKFRFRPAEDDEPQ